MAGASDRPLDVLQIGANSSDLPATVRLFAEAFGFRNAGANMLWGRSLGVQGLPPDGRAILWWMVGAQPFFQLEFFHHTSPAQRPKPADWSPADHGWGRFGVAVTDFDQALAVLARNGIALPAPVVGGQGARRAAFLEPWLMTVVEVQEDRTLPGPVVTYAASSVDDLEGARVFYRDVLGLEIVEDSGGEDELWGLEGARRRSFVARDSRGLRLEIVEYLGGRPRPADYRCSDQGVVNVCLGGTDAAPVKAAMARARAAGIVPPLVLEGGGLCCGYLTAPGREIELAAIPEARHATAGFVAAAPFIG
jgi:catechol 2,3-dioxygenase-like lactoylglutathione lyase family enzyme